MKLTNRQLMFRMRLAVEYLNYMDGKYDNTVGLLNASSLVKWVDRRKVAYMDMLAYWFEYGRQLTAEMKRKR